MFTVRERIVSSYFSVIDDYNDRKWTEELNVHVISQLSYIINGLVS